MTRLFATGSATDVFFWSATIGSLILLLAYGICLVGAMKYLFFSRPRRARTAEVLLPVAGMCLIGYTLFTNVYPVPDSPYNVFPYAVAAWLMLGLICTVAFRGLRHT
ncbi:hypothetical protein [Streptomyces coffeae]|uniref:Amino acid permease n=1 Tax=Streptomyces coffeae TaxID=621382 RepID=A0ABS1NP42_9ACTN|nr:hypothetical protein [Streptomyces coffeae]MBL1101730.1 hypothetical protein [Streptomyces coffeae]